MFFNSCLAEHRSSASLLYGAISFWFVFYPYFYRVMFSLICLTINFRMYPKNQSYQNLFFFVFWFLLLNFVTWENNSITIKCSSLTAKMFFFWRKKFRSISIKILIFSNQKCNLFFSVYCRFFGAELGVATGISWMSVK